MKLTAEQQQAIPQAVDFDPWTREEMDLLATESADLLAGDGFEEPDDS